MVLVAGYSATMLISIMGKEPRPDHEGQPMLKLSAISSACREGCADDFVSGHVQLAWGQAFDAPESTTYSD